MPGELFGLFVFTGGTVAAVLAYLVWSHVSTAIGKAQEAEKEQRWRVAFGMAEESPCAPKSSKPMRAWLPVAVLVGALAIGAGLMVPDEIKEGVPPTAADNLAARFPGAWQDEFNGDITRALIGAKVRECGRYAFRRDSSLSGEYLLYCQGSEPGWRAYLVWLPIGKVIGPLQPAADLPFPE